MSKSRGNVVIPDEYINRWGADTFRMYLMFLGPFQEGGDFRDEGISGPRRFLDKVWALVGDAVPDARGRRGPARDAGQVPPDREAGDRGDGGAAVQHQHRGADGAGERAPGGHVHAADAGGGADRHAGAVRAALRRGELGAARECDIGLRRAVARVGRGADGRGQRRGGDPGRREDAVAGVGAAGAEQGVVVEAAQRDAAVRRFTEGKEVRKVVYVPNRLLNLVVG